MYRSRNRVISNSFLDTTKSRLSEILLIATSLQSSVGMYMKMGTENQKMFFCN